MILKYIYSILLLLLSIDTFSQFNDSYNDFLGLDINNKVIQGTETDSLIPYPNKVTKGWQKIEHKKNRQELDRFIFNNKKYFEEFIKPTFTSYNLKQLRKLLHFVDINNDGKLDVLFEIDNPSDDFCRVLIFLCVTKNKYNVILDIPRFIEGFEFQDKKLSKIYIKKPGCCDDHSIIKYVFSFKYNDLNIPQIKRIHFSIYENFTHILNSSYYNYNFKRQVAHNSIKCELRSSPNVIDSLVDYEDIMSRRYTDMGNVTGIIKQNSEFLVLGEKRDKENQDWCYIQIPLKYFTTDKKELEWYSVHLPSLSVYGWINKKSLVF